MGKNFSGLGGALLTLLALLAMGLGSGKPNGSVVVPGEAPKATQPAPQPAPPVAPITKTTPAEVYGSLTFEQASAALGEIGTPATNPMYWSAVAAIAVQSSPPVGGFYGQTAASSGMSELEFGLLMGY